MNNERSSNIEHIPLWKKCAAVGATAIALFGVAVATNDELRAGVTGLIEQITPDWQIVDEPVYDPHGPVYG